MGVAPVAPKADNSGKEKGCGKIKITQEVIIKPLNYCLALLTMVLGCVARYDNGNDQQLHDLGDTFTNVAQAKENQKACQEKAKALKLNPSACPIQPYDSLIMENLFVAFVGMPLALLLIDYIKNAIKHYRIIDTLIHLFSAVCLLLGGMLITTSAGQLDKIANPDYLKIILSPDVNTTPIANSTPDYKQLQVDARKRQQFGLKLVAGMIGMICCFVCSYLALIIWRRKPDAVAEEVKKTKRELEREEEAEHEGRGKSDTLPLFFKLMNLVIISLTTYLAFTTRFDKNNEELLALFNTSDRNYYVHGRQCIKVAKALGLTETSCTTPPFLANALESLSLTLVLVCAVALISHHTFTIFKLQTPRTKKYGVLIFAVGCLLLFVAGTLEIASAVWIDYFMSPGVFLQEAISLPEIHRRQFVKLARENMAQARDAARLKWKLTVGLLCWICSILTAAVVILLYKNSKHHDVLEVPLESAAMWSPKVNAPPPPPPEPEAGPSQPPEPKEPKETPEIPPEAMTSDDP